MTSDIRIVSSTSERALAEQRALADVRCAVRALAVNLLRITRGAGKPFELEEQAAAFIVASRRLAETGSMALPADIYREALAWRRSRVEGYDAFERREARALDRIIAGAMQIAASRIMGQLTIERTGENELYEGHRELEAVGEERRREWQAALRAERGSLGKAKKLGRGR